MRKNSKIFTAFALSAALICTFSVTGNAASINISDTSISLESINKDWKEISDANTLHTFTNGTDKVTVLKYEDYDDLPAPARVDEKYGAVYQTFYCAGNEIYVVTGSAVKAADISEVKEIIDSITYPETASAKNGSTVSMNNSSASAGSQTASGSTDSSSSKNTDSSSGKTNSSSEETNSTANETDSTSEETDSSYNSTDGSSENTDSSSEVNADYAEETDDSADVNDPYDLYSWDAGTNSFIPYQQAASDGSPIGQGNGWYYYDSNSGSYLPW